MVRRYPHIIEIQSQTSERDDFGQQKQEWTSIATLAAKVKPLIGKDYIAAKQMIHEITHDIEIWGGNDIDPSMRVYFDGRSLEIISVINKDELGIVTYLKCREVVT